MNREDIIRMAREAGLHAPEGRAYILSPTIHPDDDLSEYLERFATLVASAAQAKEREACAKVAESIAKDMTDLAQWGATQCANSIRKRGQA